MLEAFAIACADLIRSNSVADHLPEHEFPEWDIKLPKMLVYPEDGSSWAALDRQVESARYPVPPPRFGVFGREALACHGDTRRLPSPVVSA
jgi:hypothetical protein